MKLVLEDHDGVTQQTIYYINSKNNVFKYWFVLARVNYNMLPIGESSSAWGNIMFCSKFLIQIKIIKHECSYLESQPWQTKLVYSSEHSRALSTGGFRLWTRQGSRSSVRAAI